MNVLEVTRADFTREGELKYAYAKYEAFQDFIFMVNPNRRGITIFKSPWGLKGQFFSE